LLISGAGKTKVQISTVAGERDAANRTNDSLKQQIGGLKAELDTLRTARDTDQNRYQQEQRQKDVARIELQEKLELLKQRKSKLNVSFPRPLSMSWPEMGSVLLVFHLFDLWVSPFYSSVSLLCRRFLPFLS
jgi:hypothetical protein